MNMYIYTWLARSVFDEEDDFVIVSSEKKYETRSQCVNAAYLDKPLPPIQKLEKLSTPNIIIYPR